MRLHPSVGMSMPRYVPVNGAKLAGHFFPPGVKVGINAAVVQYDQTVFGEDADSFNPERWLDADKEKLAQMERTMLVFGVGKRTCSGQHISICEIYKLIPTVLRNFDIELVDPGKEWKTTCYWFDRVGDVNVRVRTRGGQREEE